jgi:membrane protein
MKVKFLSLFFRKSGSIIWDTIKNFVQDNCYTKASALSFYTLQSIVPFLAFLLGIAKGFGFETYLENLLTKSIPGQREIMTHALNIANSLLKYTKEGVIIGIGTLFLLWAIINLLYYIEIALNEILKVENPRTLYRKFTDYIAIILLTIFVFVVLTSIGIFIQSHIQDIIGMTVVQTVGQLFSVFKIESWILSCCLFFILFFLMPNRRMRLLPTVIGALFAGLTFQLTQFFFVNFISKFLNYNVVYGSLAVLPLFLIWLQLSWIVALIGFELAATIENNYEKDPSHLNVNKKQLTFLILDQCLTTFYLSLPPLSDIQITEKLKTSLDTTRSILKLLVNHGILSRTLNNDGIEGYQPFCNPDDLTVKDICDALEKSSDLKTTVKDTESRKRIIDFLTKTDQTFQNSPSNITLHDLYKSV